MLRVDYRPTPKDTIAVKAQTWWTKSVGLNAAGVPTNGRWGLYRQRYDFDADQYKVDYTRVMGGRTVLEVSAGLFESWEDGPPENDQELAKLQRSTFPALATLPQFAGLHNPLNVIPRVMWGNFQSSGSNDWIPNINYDGRFPLTGNDSAINAAVNLTHTRGSHTFKLGLMREQENFGQARSGTFGGEFSFANETANPNNTGFAFANAFLGQVTSYTESMGRPGDDRRQTTFAWYAQDTWKPHSTLTVDLGLRMYKSDRPRHVLGESSVFSFERFDPSWGGRPPVLFRPITTSLGRRAVNPLTGEIVPVTYIGQMVPGTGYTCDVITPDDALPDQRDRHAARRQLRGRRGLRRSDSCGLRSTPGLAWAMNSKTVVRVAGGSFHEAHGGFYNTGGAAFRFDRVVRYHRHEFVHDRNERDDAGERVRRRAHRQTAERRTGSTSACNVSSGGTRCSTWRTSAIGRATCQSAGTTTWCRRARGSCQRIATPRSRRRPRIPGRCRTCSFALIVGFGDIEMTETTGRSNYDSLQVQLTRRYTGGVELAGAYTWAKGTQNFFNDAPQGLARHRVLRQSHSAGRPREQRSNVQEHVLIDELQRRPAERWHEPRWRTRPAMAARRLERLRHQHVRHRRLHGRHLHDDRRLRLHRGR